MRLPLFLISLFALLLPSALASRHSRAPKSTFTIPPSPVTTPSIADFLSTSNSLDAPKLHPVNGTTPEWWYFDAVSPSLNASVVIIFFTATTASFPLLQSPGVDSIYIGVSFANGTIWDTEVPASNAVITTDGEGASGVWEGSGFAYYGAPDLRRYCVTIDSVEAGVKGKVEFDAIIPPHYPCGPVRPGQNMSIAPGIGWSNAIADAVATVDLTVGNSPLKFTGVGYHDKNWSSEPLLTLFTSWYWSHLRIGPYSLVYFSVFDLTGALHVSVYLAESSQILASTCAPSLISILPYGANAAYPPHAGGGTPTGFNVTISLEKGQVFEVTSTIKLGLVGGNGIYERWIVSAKGGMRGGQLYTGVGVGEMFTLAP